MSQKYEFGHGVYKIYDNDEDYEPDPTRYRKGGPDDVDYFLITQIRYPNGVVKLVVAAADEKRKILCMNVLRRYGIEGDGSEKWCTLPSSLTPCRDYDLGRDTFRS